MQKRDILLHISRIGAFESLASPQIAVEPINYRDGCNVDRIAKKAGFMEESQPVTSGEAPKVAVITCAVLELEMDFLASQCPNVVAVHKLEQGLHNDPPLLRKRLQQAVDEVEAAVVDAEVIVLGYGLCSRGSEEVSTRRCRLVIARAHDCITLLLGSREQYASYMAAHPGTYWYSPGWNKHHTPPGSERHRRLLEQYTAKFGLEDAEFLMESEQAWFTTYDRATYVDLSIGATDEDKQYTRDCADWLKWGYDEQRGDPSLMLELLRGPWHEDRFLVLEPGQQLRMTADERIIEAIDVEAIDVKPTDAKPTTGDI